MLPAESPPNHRIHTPQIRPLPRNLLATRRRPNPFRLGASRLPHTLTRPSRRPHAPAGAPPAAPAHAPAHAPAGPDAPCRRAACPRSPGGCGHAAPSAGPGRASGPRSLRPLGASKQGLTTPARRPVGRGGAPSGGTGAVPPPTRTHRCGRAGPRPTPAAD